MGQRTVTLNPDSISTAGNSGLSIINLANIQAVDATGGIMSLTGEATVTLDNLSIGAAETITSIQTTMTGTVVSGGATLIFKTDLLESDGTQWYTENIGPDDGSEATDVGTIRTTSNGSAAWTNAEINDIKIKITFQAQTVARFYLIDHLALIVVIETPPVIQGKVRHTSGITRHTSGKIILQDIP